MKPLELKKLTASALIKSRLQEIDSALDQGHTIKQIYDFFISENEIDCSYNVFGNALRRVKGGEKSKKETIKIVATNKETPKKQISDASEVGKKPTVKRAKFVEKKEIDLNDFDNED